jgi:hypothetical protein
MKMDAGAEVLRAHALLLKLFMLIGTPNCSDYIRALSASIMLWSHYEQCQHPCWQLFQHNASAFNEESGEVSLSILARDISRGGVRSDCKKVSQTFKLVKAKAEVAEDIGIDIAGDDFGSEENGRCIKTDSPEVKATAAYLRTVIRHISSESYRHYDKECGRLASGARTARPTVSMQPFAACFRSVGPAVDSAVEKLRTSTVAFWTAAHADIWPGAVPAIDFGSDQSDVEADEAGGAALGHANGKRKRDAAQQESEPASRVKKKEKKAAEDTRVGRVVAVPAWKFGREWADSNFHRPMSAMLIGDITGLNPRRTNGKFICLMREDKGYKLHLTQSEVDEYTLTGKIAAEAKDTPWKHGEELKP